MSNRSVLSFQIMCLSILYSQGYGDNRDEISSCKQSNHSDRHCSFFCLYSNKGAVVIDLSQLDSKNGQPRFENIPDISNMAITYQWNPCTKFSRYPGCVSVNVCRLSNESDPQNYGDEGPVVKYDNLKRQFYLSYLGPVKRELGERKTNIYLVYKHTSTSRISPMISHGNYFSTTLYTKFAPHFTKLDKSVESNNHLSTGSILLIVFFGLLSLYLIIGTILKKIRHGAKGRELIPNFNFWSDLRSLIKDGCVLFTKKVRTCITSKRYRYEEI